MIDNDEDDHCGDGVGSNFDDISSDHDDYNYNDDRACDWGHLLLFAVLK